MATQKHTVARMASAWPWVLALGIVFSPPTWADVSPEQLVGTWHLISAQTQKPDGSIQNLFGSDPHGILVYDAGGRVSLQLVEGGLPKFTSGDRRRGTDVEVRAAFDGYNGYFGTYRLDGQTGVVTHHIKAGSFPNWADTEQTRYVEVHGDQLILRTTPLTLGGQQTVGVLIWRKAP